MALELAKAYVQIIPSAKGISGGIKEAISGEAGSAGDVAGGLLGGNLIGKLKAVIAAAGIGKLIKESILQGADLQQNLGGTEAVFGNFAKNLQASATEAYKNMGLSASDYMATANKMGSLFQGSGIEQAKSLDMTTKAMQRAADVASVMGIDTSMAMESIAGAAKGNFTMMDNLGVAMNATTLKAYALEKGINFDWNTASNAEKAELAMKMFMDRTSQYAGNFANESEGTISGAIGRVKAAAQDLMGNLALGNDIQPMLTNLTDSIVIAAQNLIPAIGNVLIALPGALAQTITTLGPQIYESAKGLIDQLAGGAASAIPQFFSNVMPKLVNFSGAIREHAGSLIDSGLEMLKNIAQGIADSLPTLIQTIPTIVSNIAGIINDNAPKLIATGLSIIKTLALGIINAVPTLIAEFPKIIKAIWDVMMAFNWVNLGSNVITFIKTGISNLRQTIPDLLKNIGTKAKDFFRNIDWQALGDNLINKILSGIQHLIAAIPSTLTEIGQAGVSAFKAINWIALGKDIIMGIVKGLEAAGSAVKDFLLGIAKGALDAVKGFFGIHSPSKVMRDEVGKMIAEGMAVGISDNADQVQGALDELMGMAMPQLDMNASVQGVPMSENGSKTGTQKSYTINVYPSPGMDERALAERISDLIERSTRNEELVYA